MRKNVLLFVLILLSSSAFSQFKLGFQLAPTLSANRVSEESDLSDIDSDGTGLRVALGPIADFQITDNYYISTGILFASKRAGFEISDPLSTSTIKEEYKLQYIQIPATMKLFTNEVGLDKRLYFQFGGTFEFNILEEKEAERNVLVEDFRLFDISLLVGLGMEYQLGTSTVAFAGISYHRGMVNAISEQNPAIDGDLSLKNDCIALNFGIKF